MTVRLVRTVQTSFACPSQWDAWDAEGNYYYLRYRHGYGQIRRYENENWYELHPPHSECIEVIAEFEYGDPLDGDIELDDFARLAGIEIEPVAFRTGYADHLRAELVFDGLVIGMLGGFDEGTDEEQPGSTEGT